MAFSRLQRRFHDDLFVTGNLNKIRIREMKVIACNSAREIVAETKREVEPIEASKGERIQIVFPKGAIVKPGLIFNFRKECSRHTANFVRCYIDYRRGYMQCGERVVIQARPLSEFKETIDKTASIKACDENSRCVVVLPRNESSCLRLSYGGKIVERLR